MADICFNHSRRLLPFSERKHTLPKCGFIVLRYLTTVPLSTHASYVKLFQIVDDNILFLQQHLQSPFALMIEIIDEQNIAPPLDVQIKSMLCVCFPEWAEVFTSRRVWHNTPPIFTVLMREDSEIVAHVAVVVRAITTTWNWRYNVASIQGVSVIPEKRGHRIGRELLDVTLDEIKRRGFFFAILFCKEPLVPYYTSLGWQLADDSMIMWNNRDLPIVMRSNCPMYKELTDVPLPEGPLDVHSPVL